MKQSFKKKKKKNLEPRKKKNTFSFQFGALSFSLFFLFINIDRISTYDVHFMIITLNFILPRY